MWFDAATRAAHQIEGLARLREGELFKVRVRVRVKATLKVEYEVSITALPITRSLAAVAILTVMRRGLPVPRVAVDLASAPTPPLGDSL